MRVIRKVAFYFAIFCGVGLVGIIIGLTYVDRVTKPYRFSTVESVPPKRVAIVFGALIYSRTEPSPILKDRVDMAVALYKAGKVQKVLMSGDNRSADYNEVYAMQQYALKQGMTDKDIVLDYAGLSTYDTCYRAHAIFGLSEAILVTQEYHMPRAIYSCRHLGVAAVGVEIPDWEKYPDLKIPNLQREELATFKMLWDIHVSHPKPILGKFEGIQ